MKRIISIVPAPKGSCMVVSSYDEEWMPYITGLSLLALIEHENDGEKDSHIEGIGWDGDDEESMGSERRQIFPDESLAQACLSRHLSRWEKHESNKEGGQI